MMSALPSVMRKWVVKKATTKFREAVELIQAPVPQPKLGEILVKNRFVGINASDINYTAARYDSRLRPPFDCGFEAVGEVVVSSSSSYTVGQKVAYMKHGAFAQYTVVPDVLVVPLPALKAEYLPLLLSGCTATIALDKVGEIQKGNTVLVTAAAGGTGQFAIQWAKLAGCHVIGTCSTDAKVEFLKSLGCDRPINYKKEDLGIVLKKEYPRGVNVIYESVGGDVFDTAFQSLARKGRLVVIGSISGYADSESMLVETKTPAIPMQLLVRSASVRGFFLEHYRSDSPMYLSRMVQLVEQGKLRSHVDIGKSATTGPFSSIESVPDAIDYMYQSQNIGKVVVEFKDTGSKL